ncbi:MAG: AbrB/MazE/SpoVT family DNA-binding domain-containing protein [Candidatus Omnitrophica bacterium]|nr:AbrB/MazE/SpoVT family DNA-binding domain-containing protein [Candidatus Omnitrophota bacterium]
MATFSTTRLTSKGQVVIPEDIRKRLRLKPGMQFVVIGEGDAIIFKTIVPPSNKEFQGLLDDASHQAREAGLKRSDIKKAIKKVRTKV